jgi:hypothetical protein
MKSVSLIAWSGMCSLFLLSSCGQPVCVSGIGQCDTGARFTPTATGGITLTTQGSQKTVGVGLSINVVASGGQRPYQFTVDHGDMSPPGTLQPQGDGTTALFQAPATTGWVTLRVYDSTKPTARYGELSLQVVAKP